MADKLPVTAVIFTLNEEINLPHCLESLKEFDEVVVIDSYSTDRTKVITEEFGASFHQHEFEGFGMQRNWAIDTVPMRNDWLLILDADERCTPALVAEMRRQISRFPNAGAFQLRRRFYMWGRWLRWSSLYPTWVVRLIHKDRVRYENRGHSETQTIDGELFDLREDLIDENHKGVDDWYERQLRYASKEAEYELANDHGPLQIAGLWSAEPLVRRATLKRLAWRIPARAIVYFLYAYILRLGFLDGAAGFRFCMMKAMYQNLIVVKKAEARSE